MSRASSSLREGDESGRPGWKLAPWGVGAELKLNVRERELAGAGCEAS